MSTILRNFKNQSQHSTTVITILRNFKDQSLRFMTILLYLVSRIDIKALRCSGSAFSALKKKKKSKLKCITMDKKRLGISLKVLEAVKKRFPDTKNFIDDMIDEQCQNEKISVKEVIVLQV